MLLHYFGKLKIQIFWRYSTDMEENANKLHLIASNFASRSLYSLQIKFFNSRLFYLFTFAINLWHRKFVTADVTGVSLKRREQDFDKTFT